MIITNPHNNPMKLIRGLGSQITVWLVGGEMSGDAGVVKVEIFSVLILICMSFAESEEMSVEAACPATIRTNLFHSSSLPPCV